jgi:hypothetical protein
VTTNGPRWAEALRRDDESMGRGNGGGDVVGTAAPMLGECMDPRRGKM